MLPPVEKYDFIEIALSYSGAKNPFLDVSLEATFIHPERRVRLSGFCDGESLFKLRFMPDRVGPWQYVTHSNIPELDCLMGEFECRPASPGNHGPVHTAHTFHFAYADGTRYLPVGTTCYAWNLQGNALEEQTLKTLAGAPFNKLRMCVFPKRYSFNHNEPPCYPFPGEVTRAWDPSIERAYRSSQPPSFWDFSRFNPPYFQRLEQRILELRALGIEADLILFHPYDSGAWGFDRMPPEVNDRLLRYLVARLGAMRNLWWSFANEYDLFIGRSMADWDHSMQLVQEIDPYQHLRSIHNCGAFYDHTRSWVTHCSIQHHDLQRVAAWQEKYHKPVVIDECGYEGDIHMGWGDLSPEELLMRFWRGFTLGGYVGHGETYVNEQEELWWSKGGQLKGQSAPRIAFLRRIFEQTPELRPIKKPDPEEIDLMDPAARQAALPPGEMKNLESIMAQEAWGADAVGIDAHGETCLFYFGMRQPGGRRFDLPTHHSYRIDVIDTWNMTLDTAAEAACGETWVKLPGKKFIALRIQRNP